MVQQYTFDQFDYDFIDQDNQYYPIDVRCFIFLQNLKIYQKFWTQSWVRIIDFVRSFTMVSWGEQKFRIVLKIALRMEKGYFSLFMNVLSSFYFISLLGENTFNLSIIWLYYLLYLLEEPFYCKNYGCPSVLAEF